VPTTRHNISPERKASLVYDAAGRLDMLTSFNGTAVDLGYDTADRLTEIRHLAGGAVLANYAYQLDANGNPRQVSIDAEPILPAGLINRSDTFDFNPEKNRLTQVTLAGTVSTPVFDDEGRLQQSGGTNYVFDAAHRLTARGNATYQYDGVGNRLVATRNGVVTRYVYDASGNLLAEADASGAIQRYYIHGVGLMALVTANGELYVYHHDRTGHTVALMDAQAAVVNRYAYSPYGRVLAREEAIAQPFTFVGQYGVMDEGEGFYYMRARYYDAVSGRFISEDPAGFVDGPNLYAYAGGNPVLVVDPEGTFGLVGSSYGFIAGAVGGAISGGASGVLPGAFAGAAVGFLNPAGSSVAGLAAGNVAASLVAQAFVSSRQGKDPLSLDYVAAAGAGVGGVVGGRLGVFASRYLDPIRKTIVGRTLASRGVGHDRPFAITLAAPVTSSRGCARGRHQAGRLHPERRRRLPVHQLLPPGGLHPRAHGRLAARGIARRP
jgi:RHS repeat-associated protein